MKVLKWTNKYSGEQGFVKSIDMRNKHFVNTFDITEAERYSEGTADGMLKVLEKFGEAENNDFECIDVD